MTAFDALESARGVLANLQQDHAAAVAGQAALAKTREKLALAGLTSGTAADRKKLAEATEESARIGLTVENLAFAISAAREEVAAATRAVTLEARRGQVAEVQEKIPTLRLAARTCSEALAAFVSSYSELYAASADMRRCGFRWPRDEVFAVNLRNSLQFALWSAPGHLNTQALPPPSQRLDVGDVMERFINELELSLQRELDEPVPRRAQDDYGRPPPLPRIPGEEFLVDEPAAAE